MHVWNTKVWLCTNHSSSFLYCPNRSGMYFLMHGWVFVSFLFEHKCVKKNQHVLFKLKHCAQSGSVHSTSMWLFLSFFLSFFKYIFAHFWAKFQTAHISFPFNTRCVWKEGEMRAVLSDTHCLKCSRETPGLEYLKCNLSVSEVFDFSGGFSLFSFVKPFIYRRLWNVQSAAWPAGRLSS